MSKYKGIIIKTQNKSYKLLQQLAEGGFSYIYSTDDPNIIAKLQIISQPALMNSFKKQKQVLEKVKSTNIIKLFAFSQSQINGERLGILFVQNCNGGNLFNLIEKLNTDLPQKTILKILSSVIDGISQLHKLGFAHRDIKMENVLINSKGEYKLCDFGSATTKVIMSISKQNRHEIQQDIEKNTTPLYRSPQQLDLYSGFQIGPQVDIFALGCLLFILCFKKQPFQSRLAAISMQYYIPQKHIYSQDLINIMKKCMTINPLIRPSINALKQIVNQTIEVFQSKPIKYHNINLQVQIKKWLQNLQKLKIQNGAENIKGSLMQKVKKYYVQLTTQTQGWVNAFLQETQEYPIKEMKSIIDKCWEKTYKIQKFYSILQTQISKNMNKSLVVLKILILIDEFLRKGPKQSIEETNSNLHISNICSSIYESWHKINILDRNSDKIRNEFIRSTIVGYSLILLFKIDLMRKNSKIFSGNYCLDPFFLNQKRLKIFNYKIIQNLLNYGQFLIGFHNKIKSKVYLKIIQSFLIQSFIQEQYNLINTIIHLYWAYKNSIPFLIPTLKYSINFVKLKQKLEQLDKKLKNTLIQVQPLICTDQNTVLNLEIMEYIQKISIQKKPMQQYEIQKYLSSANNLLGFKIPKNVDPFSKKLKNLKKNVKQDDLLQYFEIEQFKQKKQQNKVIITANNLFNKDIIKQNVKNECNNNNDFNQFFEYFKNNNEEVKNEDNEKDKGIEIITFQSNIKQENEYKKSNYQVDPNYYFNLQPQQNQVYLCLKCQSITCSCQKQTKTLPTNHQPSSQIKKQLKNHQYLNNLQKIIKQSTKPIDQKVQLILFDD